MMSIASQKNMRRGFTLVELVIVLGIVGILVGGLWRLVASGNSQVKDQAAAGLHSQIIAAVNAYLQTDEGQSLMAGRAAGGTGQIILPATNTSVANCRTSVNTVATAAGFSAADSGFNQRICDFIPPGFTAATTNSYGQTFLLGYLKDQAAAGVRPQSYSFMVVTTGGDIISDTSGGRISGLIGGDGGFIYTQAVCTGAASTTVSCGAFGAWNTSVTGTYNFPGASVASGHIASRTFYSPLMGTSTYWLAKSPYPGDIGTRSYNTMTTDFFMGINAGNPTNIHMVPFSAVGGTTGGGVLNMYGGALNMVRGGVLAGGGNLNMAGGDIFMTDVSAGTTGTAGGDINMAGGSIGLQGGNLNGNGTSQIVLRANAGTSQPMIDIVAQNTTTTTNALVNIANTAQPTCPMTAPGTPNTCPYAVEVNTMSVTNLLNAASIYAGTFLYNTSDARAKKNIVPLENALSDVMRLKPVSFTYKSNDKDSLGVIAQDIETVYPQLVGLGGQDMKAVNYEGLIAPLIGAVQELKKQNDDLRAQINAQAKRQKALDDKIKALSK